MKRRLTVLTALLLAMLMLASCTTGGSPTPDAATADPGTAATQAPADTGDDEEEEATPAPDTSAVEQKLTFAVLDDPDSLDPNWSQNTFSGPLLHTAFMGLMRYDLEGELVKAMAADYTVSDDGMVYTFTLHDGLLWSDGSALTAYDFEFAWNRILIAEYGSKAAGGFYPYIKNGEAIYTGEKGIEESGIKALDDLTLQVEMEVPCPFFLPMCATWTLYPVCKDVVENNPDWTKQGSTYISNGPFKLQEYKMGDGFYLVKNENYYKAEEVKLQTLTFKIMQDQNTALNAYLSGELDGIIKVPNAEIPNMRAREDFYSLPSFGHTYWLYNTTSPGLDNPLVRKALALAIDRTELIENVLQNKAQPAGGMIPPGYVQSDGVDFRVAGGDYGIGATADIEEAKRLLAEAGYEDLSTFPTLRLGYYTNDTAKKIAEALQQMYKQNLGIEMEIVSAEWSVFYDQVMALDYDICAMGSSGSILHPMDFLATWEGDMPPLETGWRNADYDALLNEIRQETDPAKAEQMMHEAEDMFMNDYPLLSLYYGNTAMMMADYVTNWNYTATSTFVFDQIEILPH